MKWKENKYIIIVFVIMLGIAGFAFYQEYSSRLGYAKGYYDIKETCYEKGNMNADMCKRFRNKNQVEEYIEIMNPKDAYKRLDAISFTCNIIETTIFNSMQFLSPLLILIATVLTFHAELSSGMIKNKLLRMPYRTFLKRSYMIALKVACLTPIILILIFLASCIFTKFNFQIDPNTLKTAVYEPWKYNNFILYGFIILSIQYIISLLYANIGLYCCKKSKSSMVNITMGYLIFIVINMLVFIVIYAIILNKLFGLKELTDFFNIAGYWFFNIGPSCAYVIPIAFILTSISSILLYYSYRNKEKVVISSEKQNS